MMPEPDNVVLIYLRRIDEKVDRVIDDVRDIKFRVTNLEEGQAGIQRRLDRGRGAAGSHRAGLDLVELPH
jgi:hypothetical protein